VRLVFVVHGPGNLSLALSACGFSLETFCDQGLRLWLWGVVCGVEYLGGIFSVYGSIPRGEKGDV